MNINLYKNTFFPYLLLSVTILLIFIYLEHPCLCQGLDDNTVSCLGTQDSQGDSLNSLKARLEKEVFTFHLAHEDHKQWSSIIKQVTRSPSARTLEECSGLIENELARLWNLDDKLYMRAGKTCSFLRECTRKMRVTEGMIKNLDPSFKSSIEKQWYEMSTSEALAQLDWKYK